MQVSRVLLLVVALLGVATAFAADVEVADASVAEVEVDEAAVAAEAGAMEADASIDAEAEAEAEAEADSGVEMEMVSEAELDVEGKPTGRTIKTFRPVMFPRGHFKNHVAPFPPNYNPRRYSRHTAYDDGGRPITTEALYARFPHHDKRVKADLFVRRHNGHPRRIADAYDFETPEYFEDRHQRVKHYPRGKLPKAVQKAAAKKAKKAAKKRAAKKAAKKAKRAAKRAAKAARAAAKALKKAAAAAVRSANKAIGVKPKKHAKKHAVKGSVKVTNPANASLAAKKPAVPAAAASASAAAAAVVVIPKAGASKTAKAAKTAVKKNAVATKANAASVARLERGLAIAIQMLKRHEHRLETIEKTVKHNTKHVGKNTAAVSAVNALATKGKADVRSIAKAVQSDELELSQVRAAVVEGQQQIATLTAKLQKARGF